MVRRWDVDLELIEHWLLELDQRSYELVIAAVELLGGFTLYPASVLGGWRDGAGRDVRDSSRVYAFAIGSIAQGGAVVALARFSCALFRQDAIFIRYLGLAEIILPA